MQVSDEQKELISKDTIDPTTGMPDITLEEKNGLDTPVRKFFNVVGPLIFIGIGTGIGFGVYSLGDTNKFDSKINMLYQNDLQWCYLSSFLFCYLVQHLNSYPMQYKARIMRGKSGQLRSNMFIYKNAAEGSPESRIVLSTEGDEAFYNRSNRALYHFMRTRCRWF